MTEYEYTFTSSTGKDEIRVKAYVPDGNIKGIVQFHHGVTSHIDQQPELAKGMTDKGYVFIGNDALGHGKIAFENNHLGWFAEKNGWEHVVNDFRSVYGQIEEKYPGLPHFVYGSSMGSFVVRSFMIRFPELKPAGVILEATSMNSPKIIEESYKLIDKVIAEGGKETEGSMEIQSFAFAGYNKRVKERKSPMDWVCADVDTMLSKPADGYSMFLFSPSLFRDMTDGQKFNSDENNIAKVRKDVPVYIVSGADDPAGNYGEGPGMVRDALLKAGVKDVRLTLYPGERHMIYMGFSTEKILADMTSWMEEVSERN